MKNNILKIVLALFVTFTYTSCEEELRIYDGGQTAYSFEEVSFNLSIPSEDLVLSIPVNVSTVSNQSRSVSVLVDVENTTEAAADGEYSLGQITIPAGSYSGVLDVAFDFSAIGGDDGDVKDLVFSIATTGGDTAFYETVSISYFREIVCNDLELYILSDVWATETYWVLETADGTILQDRFFPYTGNSATPQVYELSFPLNDGDYVFKIGDAYGDGMIGTGGGVTLTGEYSLSCSIITHASGSGAFASPEADPFAGAPNGQVEVTAFTVNP